MSEGRILLKRTFCGSQCLRISLDEDVQLSLGAKESTEVAVLPGEHQIAAEFQHVMVDRPAVGRSVVTVGAGEVLELAFRLRMRWRSLLYVYLRLFLARVYLTSNPNQGDLAAMGCIDIVEVARRSSARDYPR